MFNNKILLLLAMFLDKSYIWEKSCSWNIGQNTLSQSDCRIFKSSISSKQINEIVSFLACWYKFKKIKVDWKFFGCAWSKMVLTNLVSGLWNWLYLKNEQMDLTDFFACWYRFTKIKSWTKIYWVNMVKNVCGQSGHWTLFRVLWINKFSNWFYRKNE